MLVSFSWGEKVQTYIHKKKKERVHREGWEGVSVLRTEAGARGRVSDWSRVGLDMAHTHTHTPFGPRTFLSGSVFSNLFLYIYCCPPFLSSYFRLNEGYYIMAILWDSQKVVGGSASDVWFSSARRRVKLQAENTQHNIRTHTHTHWGFMIIHYLARRITSRYRSLLPETG